MGQVEEERFVLVLLDEAFGFGGQTIRQIFARWRSFEAGHKAPVALIRREITERRTSVITGDAEIKALSLRLTPFAAQMPLANARGRVARLLQRV